MCLDLRDTLGWWTLDPFALVTTTTSSALYAVGLRRTWRRAGLGRGVRRWEVGCFYAGQLSILLALVSPIDRLSDLLFSAHMTQHEILLLVSPMLIVLGRPLVVFAATWPDVGSVARRVGRIPPLAAVVLHGLVVWFWHWAPAFEGAMRNEAVHTVQHVTFFATAALFWWSIVRGRYGRAGYGLAVLFVFATAAHTSILGALFTFASHAAYSIYEARAATIEVDATADQELAGLVMWIPAGMAFVLAALALFAAWLGESERRIARAERRRHALQQAQPLTGGHRAR